MPDDMIKARHTHLYFRLLFQLHTLERRHMPPTAAHVSDCRAFIFYSDSCFRRLTLIRAISCRYSRGC